MAKKLTSLIRSLVAMKLTKNLYVIEEVAVALLYSLRFKQTDEALYWLNELEESLYDVQYLLLISWAMNIGLVCVTWFDSWRENSGHAKGRKVLCLQLLNCSEYDSSIMWLLMSGVVPVRHPRSFFVDKWISICRSTDFWEGVPYSGLEKFKDKLFARVIAYSLTHKTYKYPSLAVVDYKESINTCRLYGIPQECLSGMARFKNTGDIINNLDLNDSLYWSEILKSYKNTDWISDSLKEDFYDIYFQDDIPDEWSLEKKLLSHGPYVSKTFEEWWKLWIHKKCSWVCQSTIDCVTRWIGKTKIEDQSYLEHIHKLYL